MEFLILAKFQLAMERESLRELGAREMFCLANSIIVPFSYLLESIRIAGGR